MIRTARTHPHPLLPDSAGAMTEVTLLAWRTIGRNVNLEVALSGLLQGLEGLIPLPGIGVELEDGWEASAGTLEGGSVARAPLPLPERGTISVAHRSLEGHGAALAEALSEPIAVGVANARRAREAERDRVAATAERRAHLARLSRQDAAGSVIGADDGLRGVMRRVEQVAMTDAPVLLLGETGTGKEVMARALHARSARAAGPFIRVNCGAIPPELVDSELFGHERGGFTGASATRAGWFERADGGTLFLDEIGELPAAAQVRLLRVLQDGSYQRVGGQDELTADVRILAATHRDVTDLVHAGKFREDLWYRVSVFPLHIPALRERRDDIPALVAHFAASTGSRLYGRPLAADPADVRRLLNHAWPGNVRELAAIVERAAILGNGYRLDLATALGDPSATTTAPGGALEAANRRAIHDALTRTQGRIEGPFGAAAALGVNPHTLRSRMRKLGISWGAFRSPSDGRTSQP